MSETSTMETASTDIAAIVAQNPVVVLIDTAKRDDLYAHIRREVDAFQSDLTTVGGRKAIKSLAFKITRTKTAIDDAGKKLNEEARARINVVDAARRDSKATLDAMAAEVKKPLDEWEAAEAARVTRNEAAIQRIRDAAVVVADDTSGTVEARGREVFAVEFGVDWTEREVADATAARDATVKALLAARDRLAANEEAECTRLAQQEAERAELARLRAEAAERAEREAQAEAVRLAAERQAREAAEQTAWEERAAQAERDRIAAAERAAEDRVRREAEQAAAAERDRVQAAHDAEMAKQRQAAAAAQAEADRLERARRAEQAEAERIAAEDANRARNRAHVAAVMGEAKAAIMSCGANEEVARAIVLAIKAQTIPHVGITF